MQPTSAVGVPPATHPFRDAFAARDFEAMRDAMAPTVVLNSPILSARFEGRDEVLALFRVIADTLEEPRFTLDIADGDRHVMSWRTRVGTTEMEGAEILRVDEEGRIVEFTVFFRPLVGVTVLARGLGAGLARSRSRFRARLVAVASSPLVLLSRVADRVAPRLVK